MLSYQRITIQTLALLLTLSLGLLLIGQHHVFAQSAWLANHFSAKKIDILPNNVAVITTYPVLSHLIGPGPYNFDSYTQIITGKGRHCIQLRIIHDASGQICEAESYEIDAPYDGYTDGHLCNWVHRFRESGWYRIEIQCSPENQPPEIIGTFYFYQASKP